ncbi:MAG: cytochrome P460 family protein [Vicinamibacterales bacterium]
MRMALGTGLVIWLAAVATAAAWRPPAPQLPDPDAQSVWAFLEQQDYESWELFPGTTPYHPGPEPHGALLTTRVNDLALDAVRAGDDHMPVGAMIVKENYAADRSLEAVTVMFKTRPGYDPDHHDWFWMKRAPDGAIGAQGRVDTCINCHDSGTDYVREWDFAPAQAPPATGVSITPVIR